MKKTATNTGTATSETAGGAATGQPVIRRERRLTWPRLRYIVTWDRGAVEYMTLLVTGFPLAISYHSPRPRDGVRPVPCDLLGGPCYVDGTITGARELCERWLAAGKDDQVIWRTLEERYSRWA